MRVGSPFDKFREELSTGAYRRGAFHRTTWHIGLCGGDPGVEGGRANKRFRTWEPGVEEMPLHGDNGRKTLRVFPYLDDDPPVVVQLDADNCGEMTGSEEGTDGRGAQFTTAPRLQPTMVHGRRLLVGHLTSFALRTLFAVFWDRGGT
jgi:hypothetical protein